MNSRPGNERQSLPVRDHCFGDLVMKLVITCSVNFTAGKGCFSTQVFRNKLLPWSYMALCSSPSYSCLKMVMRSVENKSVSGDSHPHNLILEES